MWVLQSDFIMRQIVCFYNKVENCTKTIFFFFSSRRRHTRSLRDRSSDVCSSDLRSRHLAKLSEYQHLLLFGGNHFSDLPQTRPLAAVCLAPCPIAQPLGRVIANLLEP